MFGWFSKKEKKPERRCRDLVWISSQAKWEALPGLLVENQPAFVFGWFAETIDHAKKAIAGAGMNTRIQFASDFSDLSASGATVIVLEHYPLPQREQDILSAGYPKEILVLSALDEPLFLWFGGDRIATMMQKTGMDASERIEHSMISSRILRAQQKVSEKVFTDFSAKSMEDWFRFSGLQKQ